MATILIILVLVIAGVFIATKFFGVFEDKDKNGIPDKVEEKVAEVKKEVSIEVKKRATRVKEEFQDVKKAAKKVVKQSKDVVKAAAGKPTNRKGKKPTK
jgi:hypothetical protein